MFTGAALVLMSLVYWHSNRANQADPPSDTAEGSRDMLRYSRQDLRLIAWLLAAILVALGVIADKLH